MVNFITRMKDAIPQAPDGIPLGHWRRVARARHRMLMLDYDGTLAPLTAVREEARPTAGVLDLLRRIVDDGASAVAIVSGRPLRELERFVGGMPITLVGEHGWERRSTDGRTVQLPLDRRSAAIVDEADRIAQVAGWGDRIERKRSSVVLHTRTLPPDRAREIQARCAASWQGLSTADTIAIDHIDGGIELRAHERNKGTAVRFLLEDSPPGTLGVFLGDDVTDEDAFDAVRAWGFGVRVGTTRRTSRSTARLQSCLSVPPFLATWFTLTSGRGEVAPDTRLAPPDGDHRRWNR